MGERHHIKKLILAALVLVFLAPVFFYHMPLYYFSPDTLYVKAKILRVSEGDLFADPVTGFPNFHPPFYHLILSLFYRIGFSINLLLLLVTVFNSVLLFVFAYLILRVCFGSDISFYTSLTIPFIFQNLGPGQIFLATAFYFSLPFFLAGLWLHLRRSEASYQKILVPLLWGLAFLISPVYFFVIGFVFVYELLIKRDIKRFVIYTAVFLVTIIPFIYQTLTVSQSSMAGTGAFSIWRGLPDGQWFNSFFTYVLSPVDNKPLSWPVLPVILLIVAGVIGYIKAGKKEPFVILAAIAYLFTAYNFNSHYATRVEFLAALLIGGYALQYLYRVIKSKAAYTGIIAMLVLMGIIPHLMRNIEIYSNQVEDMPIYRQVTAGIKANLERFIRPDEFILASDRTYCDLIMPGIPAHGLLAYKTGEYYQLNSKIADEMRADYMELMGTDDTNLIEHFCRKYNIKTAVMSLGKESEFPVFQTIDANWETVYSDFYFKIYKRPL